ncbi:hypothetical protein EVA_04294, partial [gut metagenome]
MKYLNYLVSGLAMSFMVACSDSDELSGNEGTLSQGDAYLSLAISMPNGEMNGTRALNEPNEKHEGTTGEQQITTLKLFVYNKTDGKLEYVHEYKGSDLRPDKPMPGSDKSTLYTLTPFAVKAGAKKLVVVANAPKGKFEQMD